MQYSKEKIYAKSLSSKEWNNQYGVDLGNSYKKALRQSLRLSLAALAWASTSLCIFFLLAYLANWLLSARIF